MIKFIISSVILLIFALPIMAQNTEISVNANHARSNPNFTRPTFAIDKDRDQIGFDAALAGYFGKTPLGLKLSVACSWQLNETDRHKLTTVMGGPTLKLRKYKVQPFGHGLVGISRFTIVDSSNLFRFDRETSGIAYAVGGGLDIKLTEHFAIRAFQGDLVTTRIDRENVRYWKSGVGVVFNF